MTAILLALALSAPPDKAPATLDEKIAAALKNHPDIKAAEAKKLLAEAELEQARLTITQKVSAAVTRVELAKVKLEEATLLSNDAERMRKGALISEQEALKARTPLLAAKAELAAAELELQQLVGRGGQADAKPATKPQATNPDPLAAKLLTGPVSEKLETALRLQFKLDFKDMEVKKAFEGLMTVAKLDDIPVRGLKFLGGDILKSPLKFDKLSGQNTFDGWVQLFVDEINANQDVLLPQLQGKYDVYVREYGLLVERVANAPADALTLTQFARAVRAKAK